MPDNNNLQRLNDAARAANEAARSKSPQTRRAEEAARARDREAYFEQVVEGERNAQEQFGNERYKG